MLKLQLVECSDELRDQLFVGQKLEYHFRSGEIDKGEIISITDGNDFVVTIEMEQGGILWYTEETFHSLILSNKVIINTVQL